MIRVNDQKFRRVTWFYGQRSFRYALWFAGGHFFPRLLQRLPTADQRQVGLVGLQVGHAVGTGHKVNSMPKRSPVTMSRVAKHLNAFRTVVRLRNQARTNHDFGAFRTRRRCIGALHAIGLPSDRFLSVPSPMLSRTSRIRLCNRQSLPHFLELPPDDLPRHGHPFGVLC